MSGPGQSSALADRLPQLLAPVLGPGLRVGRVEPLSGGASRQTWGVQVRDGDGREHELVLRTGRAGDAGGGRDPGGARGAGRDPGGAGRDAGRDAGLSVGLELEAASQRAAAAAGMPVPAVLCASDDPGALGHGYLISARVPGQAIARRILRGLPSAEARGALLAQCATALAALHAADPDGIPGLPEADPLAQWGDLMDALGQPSAVFEVALRWLLHHRPAPGGTAIVHGDFRLGNLMVDDARLAAVLDWELVHRGDPLEDLGWFCVRAWRFGEDARPAGGLGSIEEFVAGYERAAGAAVDRDAVRWWQVLGTLRWGVLCQYQAHRHLSGETRSAELAAVGRRACENEWDLLELLAEQGDLPMTQEPGGGHPVRGHPGSGHRDSGDAVSGRADSGHPDSGHPVYGRPTLGELVAAVREWLAEAGAGHGPAPSGYGARVAANALAIVERELARGADDQRAYAALLARLGVAGEAALAADIRAGRRDHQLAEIAREFRAIVAARLAVAHPGYDTPDPGRA